MNLNKPYIKISDFGTVIVYDRYPWTRIDDNETLFFGAKNIKIYLFIDYIRYLSVYNWDYVQRLCELTSQ